MSRLIESYNAEVDRYRRNKNKMAVAIDDFVDYQKLKWTHNLKAGVAREQYATLESDKIRVSFYRPFCKRYLYFDRLFNERVYRVPHFFPNESAEKENRVICCTIHTQMPFTVQITNCIPNEAVGGRNGQCLPFYDWDEDGESRRENITDWALEHFRKRYPGATKWDIFYYVYGVLHHPEYREKYAENLKRELPRIPLAKEFRKFAEAGRELARLHVEYESVEPWELGYIEARGKRLSYRAEDKMRLAKDRKSLKVNDSLMLAGIPAEAFEYRLGNRSALEWVIDQYRIKEDKRSGIRSDPNRAADPEYIVRLVGQVIRVSVETVRIVKALPGLEGMS